MAEKTPKQEAKKVVDKKVAQEFSYRCIKKNFTVFKPSDVVTPQKHLEHGQGYEVIIVDDRNVDWLELANKDVDKVGMKYVLDMARRGQVDISSLGIKEEETGMDISMIDPMDPNSVKNLAASSKTSSEKLKKIADQLGCSSDDLVKALLDGSLDTFIQSKVDAAKKVEGGQENA